LSVADSAPGAQADELSRLFEPLYRADAARGRHTGGSGLGLAICDALAQAHGGSMAAQASPLGGLLITAVLPIQARSQTT
jgi:two-component system sensor histidine kinase BaeS